MNRPTARPPRVRKSRFSIAPVILGLGLLLGHQLVWKLVPTYWGSVLPGGLERARHFRGWAGLLWVCAVVCHRDFVATISLLGVIAGSGLLLSTFCRPMRPIVWLMALAVIVIDGGIVYVMMRTAVEVMVPAFGSD
jgi:hypothetical protein